MSEAAIEELTVSLSRFEQDFASVAFDFVLEGVLNVQRDKSWFLELVFGTYFVRVQAKPLLEALVSQGREQDLQHNN